MAAQPSKTNKLLAKLLCASLWRKGALCCTVNCSCFNDVEDGEAQREKAKGAKYKYESEKLAAREKHREQAAERRSKRRQHRRENKKKRRSKSGREEPSLAPAEVDPSAE